MGLCLKIATGPALIYIRARAQMGTQSDHRSTAPGQHLILLVENLISFRRIEVRGRPNIWPRSHHLSGGGGGPRRMCRLLAGQPGRVGPAGWLVLVAKELHAASLARDQLRVRRVRQEKVGRRRGAPGRPRRARWRGSGERAPKRRRTRASEKQKRGARPSKSADDARRRGKKSASLLVVVFLLLERLCATPTRWPREVMQTRTS